MGVITLTAMFGAPRGVTAAQPAGCDLIGRDELPVIFVHGWLSDPTVWTGGVGSSTFRAVDASDSAVALPFDYSDANTDWVTDERIGAALAELIDCAARASDFGQVIIVAHSMGGLAARYAASQPSTAGEVGLVVTVGTPHKGTKFFNDRGTKAFKAIVRPMLRLFPREGAAREAMHPDSSELSALRMLEDLDVPALYLAGDLRNARRVPAKVAGTDGLVATTSAVPTQPIAGPGGGTRVFRCRLRIPCWHTNLPGLGGVRDAVLDAVESWILENERSSGNREDSSSGETDEHDASGAAPATPSDLTVTAQGNGVFRLRWADNATNETGFRITEWHPGCPTCVVGWDTVPANTTSYDWVSDLTFGSTRCYSVRAEGEYRSSVDVGPACTAA